jgi:hypothetical protein
MKAPLIGSKEPTETEALSMGARLRWRLFNSLIEYDVFVSYSSKESKWVRRLVADLQRGQMRVFVDEKSLIPGKRWDEQLQKAIRKCGAGIAVVGPNFLDSKVISQEWDALDKRRVRDGIPFIPVVFGGAQFPGLLVHLHGIDFQKLGRQEAIDRLKKGIRADSAEFQDGVKRRWRTALSLSLILMWLFAFFGGSISKRFSTTPTGQW